MNTKNSIVVDNQYFANIIYYKNIVDYEYIIIEQYDEHKKKSFANRSVIAGANGKINLTVPLEKGRSQKTISKDVRIWNGEKWQLRHWRSILSSYNNSPWFEYLSDDLSVIFTRQFDFLLDWNLACFDWTLKFLKPGLQYGMTTEWLEKMPNGVLDLRDTLKPGEIRSTNPVRYPQVFENKIGFHPDLSILDLLFCEGPKNSILLLQGQR